MASFISGAKKVTDVRGFLRDAAGGSSIKYMAEKGCKHLIYIPYVTASDTDENGQVTQHKEPVAISGEVHEWQSPDGKFRATVCMKDFIRKADDGVTVLNDGSCPFCDRVSDAWDIYNYRKEMEEAKCQLTGEERKKHLEKANRTFADELKARKARVYMYMLVVKFRLDAAGNPVIGTDGVPEYDLKIMKMSASRVEKIQQQIANSGAELPDSELIFEYPAVDDKRLQVSQSTTAPVFPNNKLTLKYPNLLAKIQQDVAKFDFEGIDKSFPEWAGMTTEAAKTTTDALFEKWDEYRKLAQVNPQAMYMEYVSNTPVTQPSLGGLGAPVIPGAAVPTAAIPEVAAPQIPGAAVPGAAVPSAPTIPNIPSVPNIPSAPAPVDPNGVFGGAGGNITI